MIRVLYQILFQNSMDFEIFSVYFWWRLSIWTRCFLVSTKFDKQLYWQIMKKYDIINSFHLDVPDENFIFSQPTICGKSRSMKLIISRNSWFFVLIIKPPSPDNTSGKGGSSFLEMEHDYQWLIHKVKLFAFETIWWRRGVQWYNHLFATFQNGKCPKLRGFLPFYF